MQDVSGFGFVLSLRASVTFPVGFTLSAFADDADPFDLPKMAIAGSAMGLNGDLITWSRATEIKSTISVINGSLDDINLGIIFEANRPGRGKFPAGDVINITAVYPGGQTLSLRNGRMIEGMPGSSVASAGRQKTMAYDFVFENRTASGILQAAATLF